MLDYQELRAEAHKRLNVQGADNLCGMAGMTVEQSRLATFEVLMLTLKGGWSYGLLPLMMDIATFCERDSSFLADNGDYGLGEMAALLIDALKNSDHESISYAKEALRRRSAHCKVFVPADLIARLSLAFPDANYPECGIDNLVSSALEGAVLAKLHNYGA